ncbi:MAG TPA: hypothetical protein VFB43_17650 [Terracidiphilus sp.]|nr:hypothetical protein [Terracidiphilus sp.]
MKFSEWRRAKGAWNSWWSLLITFPLLIVLAFVVPEAWRSGVIAGREQSIAGVVTAYRPSDHNRCDYVFTVQGRQFTGTDGCPNAPATIGQQVWVYFDSNNPATSELEGFAEKSQADWSGCWFILIVICIVAGIIAFAKVRSRFKFWPNE